MEFLRSLTELDAIALARALLAFAVVVVAIPLSLPLARRWNWYDLPGGRKQHDLPTPVVGGVAILLAIVVAAMAFDQDFGVAYAAFFGAAVCLVVTGQLDDRYDLNWRVRIAVQVGAALAMALIAGHRVQRLDDVIGVSTPLLLLWLSLPFTVFVVVGVINAINMIDGVDGLAGGQVLVSLLFFVAFALYAGNGQVAERLLATAAATAGFLLWNFRFPWQPRARVFLGNAGSMLLGFIIAWAAVRLTQDSRHPISPVLGPWTIAIPLIDCVSLMVRRWQHGRSPFLADRDHLHHLLLDAGYSVTGIALGLMVLSAALGSIAALAVKLGVYRPLVVLAFFFLLGAFHWFRSDRERAVARLRALRLRRGRAEPAAPAEPAIMPATALHTDAGSEL